MSARKFRLALDWEPNTNHTGLFVAIEKGFYKASHIEVEIMKETSVESAIDLLIKNQLEGVICPSEYLIKHRIATKHPQRVKAVASILAKNPTGIAVKKDSGIQRPRDLAGKTVALSGFPYEEELIKCLISKDQGQMSIKTRRAGPNFWDEFRENKADCVWIYENWQGVEAKEKGIDLTLFKLEDFGLDYSYPLVLLCHEALIASQKEFLQDFLKATSRGYREAWKFPKESAKVLSKRSRISDLDFLERSQAMISPCYLNHDLRWGSMEQDGWNRFVAQLGQEGLLRNEDNQPVPFEVEDVQAMFINLVPSEPQGM